MENVKAILLKQMEILSRVCDTEATSKELPELTDAMLGIAVLLINNAPAEQGEGINVKQQAEAYHRAIERFAKRNDTLDSIYKEFTMLKQESEQKKPDGIIKRFRRFIGS